MVERFATSVVKALMRRKCSGRSKRGVRKVREVDYRLYGVW